MSSNPFMLRTTLTDQDVKRLCQCAQRIPPSPRVSYALVHPEVQVPENFLAVKIAQYYQYNPVTGARFPNFWSIFIPTSEVPGVGMHYNFGKRIRFGFHERHRYHRGSHTVGYVFPTLVPTLESHFAHVSVYEPEGGWESQIWVCLALQGWGNMINLEWLNPAMFVFVEDMTYQVMAEQMRILEAAWEDGNAQVF